MLSMHYCKQKPDFLNALFNSLIEEEKLYPQVLTCEKDHRKCLGTVARRLVGQGQNY